MRRLRITRAVRRRWQPALVTIVSGLFVAMLLHPDWGTRDYQATNVLYSPAAARASGGTTPQPLVDPFVLKPAAIAALATSRQTAIRVADHLGFDGSPLALIRRVTAKADPAAGTIAITARHGDPAGAVAIANAVADELTALVDESRAGARQKAIDEATARGQQLGAEIAALDPHDPLTPSKKTQLNAQAAAASAEADALSHAGSTSGISTIRPAQATTVTDRSLRALPPIAGWTLTLLLLLGLGSAVAVVADRADDRLDDASTAEDATGLPVLSEVPPVPATAHADGAPESSAAVLDAHRRLVRAVEELGVAANGARRIDQTATPSFVVPSGARGPGRVVLFTSPSGGEGATDSVIGFAGAVAASGRTALIVDCDDAPADDDAEVSIERGLGDLAADGIIPTDLSRSTQPTALARVTLVPRGDARHSAAELLVRHEHLVSSARSLADVVILHGPAVSRGDAAARLAALADDVVVVCRSGVTRTAEAQRAANAVRAAARPAGVVLVDAHPAAGEPITVAAAAARLRTDKKLRGRLEWVGAAAGCLVLYLFLHSLVFQSFSIPTESMSPYLRPGDHVLVSLLSYQLHAVHRGDVIVFNPPKSAVGLRGERLIKRVIALPGETVESKDGRLYVNDKPLAEPYLTAGVRTDNVKRQTIPAGRYWVMGDNRPNSADSRFFGTITGGSIIGRAFFHLWPTPIGLM